MDPCRPRGIVSYRDHDCHSAGMSPSCSQIRGADFGVSISRAGRGTTIGPLLQASLVAFFVRRSWSTAVRIRPEVRLTKGIVPPVALAIRRGISVTRCAATAIWPVHLPLADIRDPTRPAGKLLDRTSSETPPLTDLPRHTHCRTRLDFFVAGQIGSSIRVSVDFTEHV
jgi:hypothetical protein